jgi:hypothetical protein
MRWNCDVFGGLGSLRIRPAELLPVGGAITLAYLWCGRCVPSWQIDQVQLDQPPWSDANLQPGDRFRCPACRGPVSWHIHGPAWRPTYRSNTSLDAKTGETKLVRLDGRRSAIGTAFASHICD